MSALASGSAYLAIDSNTVGRINDGSELFGTRSGNGFTDLARFDDDGNRWLDENDDVFERLRIWQPDPVGKASLETLHDRGVGALYLGSTETPFSLTDPEKPPVGPDPLQRPLSARGRKRWNPAAGRSGGVGGW